MVVLLKDMSKGTVAAVSTSKTSTAEETQSAVNKIREIEDYQWGI